PTVAKSGALFAQFKFPSPDRGRIELRFEYSETTTAAHGNVIGANGKVLATYDDNWEWNTFRNSLTNKPKHAASATVAIFTTPAAREGEGPTEPGSRTAPARKEPRPSTMNLAVYNRERQLCADTWTNLMSTGAT